MTALSDAENWVPGQPGFYTLGRVLATSICDSYRGVDEDGFCR